jgi:hypothetical protein
MKIIIETIPHAEQRYPTAGDWQFTPDGLKIKVSKMSDERYCILVAIHELIEAVACRQHTVSASAVDAFDKEFERVRQPDDTSEPGDAAFCPYGLEHSLATGIERIMAQTLGVSWNLYEKEVESL